MQQSTSYQFLTDPASAPTEALLQRYDPLCTKIARRYASSKAEQEELTQVAKVALWKSVQRYKSERGANFTTFAWSSIEGEIKRHFRNNWPLHVPRSLQELYLRTSKAREVISNETGKTPTPFEIAQITGDTLEDARLGLELEHARKPYSFDVPDTTHNSNYANQSALIDHTAATTSEIIETRDSVERLLNRLPPAERQVVKLRFWDELSQQEIAEKICKNQMYVSRVLSRSMAIMRREDQ